MNRAHALVKLTVGTQFDRDNRPVSLSALLATKDYVIETMAQHFGGVTWTTGEGAWYNPQHNLVQEQSMTFESVVTYTLNVPALEGDALTFYGVKYVALSLADVVRQKLNQQSVLVTIQKLDTAEFVSEPSPKE